MRRVEEGWRREDDETRARIVPAAQCRRLSRWSLLEARAAGRVGGTGGTEPCLLPSLPHLVRSLFAASKHHPPPCLLICSPRCYLIASTAVKAGSNFTHTRILPSVSVFRLRLCAFSTLTGSLHSMLSSREKVLPLKTETFDLFLIPFFHLFSYDCCPYPPPSPFFPTPSPL